MNRWVLCNQSTKPTVSGGPLTAEALAAIAWAVEKQMNEDFQPLCGGGSCSIRVGSSPTDVKPGEKAFYFVDTLPDAPGASAYPMEGKAYCAVTTCKNLFGPNGVSVDASHEVLEDAGNPDCNLAVDDGRGQEHEWERCDAIETQTYVKKHPSGQVAYVSNFLLDSWVDPSSRGPFTYMASKGIKGFVEPPGPFRTAAGGGGNYQLVFPSTSAKQVFGRTLAATQPKSIESAMEAIQGFPRKRNAALHWTSRASRIIRAHNLATQSSK